MRRKLVRQGKSTLTVSLPKKWIEKNVNVNVIQINQNVWNVMIIRHIWLKNRKKMTKN